MVLALSVFSLYMIILSLLLCTLWKDKKTWLICHCAHSTLLAVLDSFFVCNVDYDNGTVDKSRTRKPESVLGRKLRALFKVARGNVLRC